MVLNARRGCDQPHSRTVLPVMSAERAVRRARAVIADQHCRRNARGVSAADIGRIGAVAPTLLFPHFVEPFYLLLDVWL
jgi:hypothetical protein